MVNLAAPNSWLDGVNLTGLPAKAGEVRAMDDAAIFFFLKPKKIPFFCFEN
jgi:hypothetical protein